MQNISNSVRILSDEVARKIAAGEVIDKPNAVVRELMDNALDSGATSICVEIYGGGIDKIRVTDDGCGMTKQDLENCAKTHATSKITNEQDLLKLDTLGFRGEALASIASVSRLEITSKRENNLAYKLYSDISSKDRIEIATLQKGTIVQSEALFENFPARRVFLKRPSSEATLCKQTFVEKAISFPQISFKLIMDGKVRLDLPKTESKIQRFVQAMELKENANLFYEINRQDENENNWNYTFIIGDSSITRADRKQISIYVNNRKITEYSLVQAIEYGVTGSFPNGTHPVACLFLNIDPSLVDFNIHPAKKEARFKDLTKIHHSISSETRKIFIKENVQKMKIDIPTDTLPLDFVDFPHDTSVHTDITDMPHKDTSNIAQFENNDVDHCFERDTAGFGHNAIGLNTVGFTHNDIGLNGADFGASRAERVGADYKASYLERNVQSAHVISENSFELPRYNPEPKTKHYDFKYLGSAFNIFLLAEKNDAIYAIDQHAAHERILFDELVKNAGQKQPLLFPFEIETENEEQNSYLESIKDAMNESGFELKNEDGKWQLYSVPVKWQGNMADIQKAIFENCIEPKEFMRHFLATCACKAAIKEGYYIDRETACDLIEKTFALPDPHCPHGRPVWFILSREEMYQRVKRT